MYSAAHGPEHAAHGPRYQLRRACVASRFKLRRHADVVATSDPCLARETAIRGTLEAPVAATPPARRTDVNPFGRGDDATRTADPQETDEQALARYRYMLQTAPPEDIERAHEEAFSRLTPDQRRQALQALSQVVPPSEIRGDDPASLARTATRAEVRQPGTIERAWGGGGPGMGSWFLSTLAASFLGTAIAQSFFANDLGADQSADTGGDTAADDSGQADTADYGGDSGDGGDFGGGDFGGGDFGGGDFGDFGGI
jgi:hypothetical protein